MYYFRMFSRLKYGILFVCLLIFTYEILLRQTSQQTIVLKSKVKFIFDIELINDVAESIGFQVHILDRDLLSYLTNQPHSLFRSPFILGLDAKFIDKLSLIRNNEILRMNNMNIEVFYNEKPLMQDFGFKLNSPIALVLERNYAFIVYILYPREDNTLWFGNLASDLNCSFKLKRFLKAILLCNSSVMHENLLNQFQISNFEGFRRPLSHVLIPKDRSNFIAQSLHSDFLECNYSRAELFRKTYIQNLTNEAIRFKHRAWKLLSKAKTILDLLSVPFWISSGTCLGFFRECDFIPYSKDVDIGIFAKYYNENIIVQMESHGLVLKHWFGKPNDSLELSFIDQGGLKLDIFFFYEEEKYFWNGGTQLRTGKKFKYIFPKFNLCWTFFCGLKVRVPCQTESYIVANYGDNWFTPIYEWDWKSSPHNVVPNGFWPFYFSRTHLLKEVLL